MTTRQPISGETSSIASSPTFSGALLNAPADLPVFIDDAGALISAGQIRHAAAAAQSSLGSGDGPIFVHTQSVALFCAAYLTAVATGRRLVLLAQSGAEFRTEAGVADDSYLSDMGDAGVRLALPPAGADAVLPDNETQPILSFFTSGSSGAAKEVVKTADVIALEALTWRDRFDGSITHVASTVSHQHIYGLIFRVFLPVLGGFTAADSSALSWEAALGDHDGTGLLIVASPAHLSRLPGRETVGDCRPQAITSSGGPLAYEGAIGALDLFGVSPIEVLGSTETGGVAWRQRGEENAPWTPVRGVRAELGDEGQLMVTSPFTGEPVAVQMGDRAEMFEDGRFRLLGRVDRIIKVEGKRVSLDRVQRALKDHELVEDIVVLPTDHSGRERLSALVVLTPEGKLALGEQGAFQIARKLRTERTEALEPAERPKRWRFVPDIPVNSQGKRVQRDLAQLFDAPRMMELLAPVRVEVDGWTAKVSFNVPDTLPWLAGHFTETPIVAGVAQVHMACRMAEEIWSVSPASTNAARLKFQQVMRPGHAVTADLSFNPETQRLTLGFTGPNARYSTGTIG